MKNIVLELKTNNHSGVMSHITGLFSRRGYNLEGILCGPVRNTQYSRIYLLVNDGNALNQILSQLEKLYDVLEIKIHEKFNTRIFSDTEIYFSQEDSVRPIVN